ncbi:hypothetical protein GCM10010377_05150 [Streptomyces viridiviolaceus]|nr:hypothetical protein GCM10010377_05150 [Streptomyces viridiviolaceus]
MGGASAGRFGSLCQEERAVAREARHGRPGWRRGHGGREAAGSDAFMLGLIHRAKRNLKIREIVGP